MAESPRIKASAEEMAALAEWPADKDAYEFRVKIGEGNFADVHVAWVNGESTRVCAVKKMNFERLDIPMEHIRKEITTMSRCIHPNVLGLHKSFTDKEYLYIVLPYMECGSFRDVIVQREEYMGQHPDAVLLEEDWIAMTISETCKGLEYIHKSGWMHRDLKAANILLNRQGMVKIADFGVAGMKDTSDPILRKQEQQRRTFVGTPCWMAPEVMRQEEGYSDRADVWSLGICVLELAKSYPPYAKERAMKVLLRTIRDPAPTFDTYKEFEPEDAPKRKFSANIKNFVRALLVKDAKGRPTASKCLSLPFLKPFANRSELCQQRLRDELCTCLTDVDQRQSETTPHTMLVRGADGTLQPVEIDENGEPILPPEASSLATGRSDSVNSDGGGSVVGGASADSRTGAGETPVAGGNPTGTAVPPDDISVTDLSRGLADLSGANTPASASNVDSAAALLELTSIIGAGDNATGASGDGDGSTTTSSGQGTAAPSVATTPAAAAGEPSGPVLAAGAGAGASSEKFTQRLTTKRVSLQEHNGSTSLEVSPDSKPYVDLDTPFYRPHRFLTLGEPGLEKRDVLETVLRLMDEAKQARLHQQAAAEAASAAADAARLSAQLQADADSLDNKGAVDEAGAASTSPAADSQSAVPAHEPTAEEEAALAAAMEAAMRKKQAADAAKHASLEQANEFENAFAALASD